MIAGTEVESIEQLDFTPSLPCESPVHDLIDHPADAPARWIALIQHARTQTCDPQTVTLCDDCLATMRRYIARYRLPTYCSACTRVVASAEDLLVVIGELNP